MIINSIIVLVDILFTMHMVSKTNQPTLLNNYGNISKPDRQSSKSCDCGWFYRTGDKCSRCGQNRPIEIDEPMTISFKHKSSYTNKKAKK
jgi:hypothetical protein